MTIKLTSFRFQFVPIIVLLLSSSSLTFSQGYNPDHIEYFAFTPIKFEGDAKFVFDSVFPGVLFRYADNLSTKGMSFGAMQLIFYDSVYSVPEWFNFLLNDVNLLKRPGILLADTLIIKAMIYLYHQKDQDPSSIYKIKSIKISPCRYKYLKPDHVNWPDSITTFNYSALVEYDTTGWNPFWLTAEYYFLLQKQEILSSTGVKYGKYGKSREYKLGALRTIHQLRPEQIQEYRRQILRKKDFSK